MADHGHTPAQRKRLRGKSAATEIPTNLSAAARAKAPGSKKSPFGRSVSRTARLQRTNTSLRGKLGKAVSSVRKKKKS